MKERTFESLSLDNSKIHSPFIGVPHGFVNQTDTYRITYTNNQDNENIIKTAIGRFFFCNQGLFFTAYQEDTDTGMYHLINGKLLTLERELT